MDKYKITNHQIFSIMAMFVIGTGVIVAPSTMAGLAKQDAWIGALITLIMGMGVLWLNCFLVSLYPGKTYIEIIQLVFGKWIGPIIIINFVFFGWISLSGLAWYVGNFMTINVMPETPSYAIMTIFVIVLVIAVIYGLETIVRSADIFVYIASAMFIFAIALVLPNVKFDNLLPAFEEGIGPIVKGAFFLSSFTTLPCITVFFLLPFDFNSIQNSKKSIYGGYLWGMAIIFTSILVCILVLGSTITARSVYPTYLLAKEINVGSVLNRLESIIAGVWLITLFFRAVLYYASVVFGISELLGLRDYRKIVIPIGFIALIYTNVIYPNEIYEIDWDSTTWILYSVTIGFILPVIMLIITGVKKIVSSYLNRLKEEQIN